MSDRAGSLRRAAWRSGHYQLAARRFENCRLENEDAPCFQRFGSGFYSRESVRKLSIRTGVSFNWAGGFGRVFCGVGSELTEKFPNPLNRREATAAGYGRGNVQLQNNGNCKNDFNGHGIGSRSVASLGMTTKN